MKFLRTTFKLIIAASLFVVFGVQAEPAPTASVIVTQAAGEGGTVIYKYRVVNSSGQPIVGFAIGSDYFHGVSELGVYPSGWNIATGIPAGNVSSAAKWGATVISTEESPYIEIEWRNNGTADVLPTQGLDGFSVVVPRADLAYSSSHWTVFFGDATVASGSLLAFGTPRIKAKVLSATQTAPGWWTVAVELENSGSDVATDLSVSRLAFRTLAGQGSVTTTAPALPARIGRLEPGGKTTMSLTLSVPDSVKKFSIAESGTLVSGSGATLNFSSSQVVYPKN